MCRRIKAGVILRVAGTGTAGFSGDNGSALAANIQAVALAVDASSNVYIADSTSHRIRRIDANGLITTIAGTGTAGFSADGSFASVAQLSTPVGLAVGKDGSIYVADSGNSRVRRITNDGRIFTVAGNGSNAYNGDAGAALLAGIGQPQRIALASDGSLYIAHTDPALGGIYTRLRRVNPANIITTLAGKVFDLTSAAHPIKDNLPAPQAALNTALVLVIGADGKLYVGDKLDARIYTLGNGLPGFNGANIPIPSQDGNEIFLFDPSGRHLQTIIVIGRKPDSRQ